MSAAGHETTPSYDAGVAEGPLWRGGYPLWEASAGDYQVRFVGRGETRERDATLAAIEAAPPAVAALRQIHSDRVAEVACGGFHGEGDALVTGERGLALSVITADCVPLLLAGGDRIAAVHAGWRGIVGGVVAAGLERLAPNGPLQAWIGPAIGPCCYEVGPEVADQVVAVSGAEVAIPGPAGKPHLDVRRAVALQLAAHGIVAMQLGPCTRCHPQLLWSYRREGKHAGRNISFIWRR